MTTPVLTSQTHIAPIDLTVIPQSGTTTPSGHLTTDEAAHVIRDWQAYGNTTPGATHGTWTIGVIHFIDGEARVTSILPIPRSVKHAPTTPARRATNVQPVHTFSSSALLDEVAL